MKLYINTANNAIITVELRHNSKVLLSEAVEANHQQAEKLLPLIDSLLKSIKATLKDITSIVVEDQGEGFTSLRIGVATANALAYALGISLEVPKLGKVKIVEPKYARGPSITVKNR